MRRCADVETAVYWSLIRLIAFLRLVLQPGDQFRRTVQGRPSVAAFSFLPAPDGLHQGGAQPQCLFFPDIGRERGYHAKQVILCSHEVHRLHLSAIDDEFQRAGEAFFTFLAMDDEGGFGEKGGDGDGFEDQFIVQDAVVVNFPSR